MKRLFAVAALLVAFSPLSQAQNYPQAHPSININLNQPWQPGPNMRNDREVIIVDKHYDDHHHKNAKHRHHKAKPHVRCRDGSRQYTARGCRHHRGVR